MDEKMHSEVAKSPPNDSTDRVKDDSRPDSPSSESNSDSSFHSIEKDFDQIHLSASAESAFDNPAFIQNSDSLPNKAESGHTPSFCENPNPPGGKDDGLLDQDIGTDEFEDAEDEHFIDEEYLKDMELNLNEDEKKSRHSTALEKKCQGNESYKSGNFCEALQLYTAGLKLCPLSCREDRAILYANRAAARSRLGQKKNAISDCDVAIELNSDYVKAYLRRANLREETDLLDEALKDFQRVLELDPSNAEARQATYRLPPKIEERNEKLKAEMMGKLKDLGNMFLRPFGLSTNNFNLQQDPQTGGYNISFQQNPPNS